jgi:hypothetical protein
MTHDKGDAGSEIMQNFPGGGRPTATSAYIVGVMPSVFATNVAVT